MLVVETWAENTNLLKGILVVKLTWKSQWVHSGVGYSLGKSKYTSKSGPVIHCMNPWYVYQTMWYYSLQYKILNFDTDVHNFKKLCCAILYYAGNEIIPAWHYTQV